MSGRLLLINLQLRWETHRAQVCAGLSGRLTPVTHTGLFSLERGRGSALTPARRSSLLAQAPWSAHGRYVRLGPRLLPTHSLLKQKHLGMEDGSCLELQLRAESHTDVSSVWANQIRAGWGNKGIWRIYRGRTDLRTCLVFISISFHSRHWSLWLWDSHLHSLNQ